MLDPYAHPGVDRKAQLHCHSTGSDGRYPPEAVVERYRQLGFSFVAITDHDTVTDASRLSDHACCVIPGVEVTVPRPVRPFGPHLGCLFVHRPPQARTAQAAIWEVVQAGGVAGLNHPSWTGNLWTARWGTSEVRSLRGFHFVEVWNPHSDPELDTRRWVQAVRWCGPEHPVAPVAADDFHRDGQLGRGWVVVRVPSVTAAALREALLRGAAYATTGPQAAFGVRKGAVWVESDAGEVRFYRACGRMVHRVRRGCAQYEPAPQDGFVRVECHGATGHAWSSAFWVLPDP
ncbi:MAG: hypothetical protein C4304_06470 [candidate division GAL15 bacterium]